MRTPLFYIYPPQYSLENHVKTGKKCDLPKPLEREAQKQRDKKEEIIALKIPYLDRLESF